MLSNCLAPGALQYLLPPGTTGGEAQSSMIPFLGALAFVYISADSWENAQLEVSRSIHSCTQTIGGLVIALEADEKGRWPIVNCKTPAANRRRPRLLQQDCWPSLLFMVWMI